MKIQRYRMFGAIAARKMFVAFCFGMLCSTASATTIPEKPLIDMVAESDHVLIGEVKKVEMIDGAGREVTDLNGRTGWGYTNTIRLNVAIKRDGILKSNKSDTPYELTISLWPLFIGTLGNMQYMQGKEYIFLLKGDDYKFVYPMGFIQELSKRKEVEKIIRNEPVA
jgi:hypothetical protein